MEWTGRLRVDDVFVHAASLLITTGELIMG